MGRKSLLYSDHPRAQAMRRTLHLCEALERHAWFLVREGMGPRAAFEQAVVECQAQLPDQEWVDLTRATFLAGLD